MKLCYISGATIPSIRAQTIQIMEMCSAFAQLGCKVELLVPRKRVNSALQEPNIFEHYGVDQNFYIKFLRSFTIYNRFGAPTSVLPALNYVRKINPEFCYVRNAWAIPIISTLDMPIIYESHDFHYGGSVYGRLTRSIVMRYLKKRKIKLFVCVSEALRDLWVGAGCDEENLIVAPDGVNLERYIDFPGKHTLRAELGLPLDNPICCYCGHLYQDRGIENILIAAKELKNCLFLIVGGYAEDVARYRNLTMNLNMKNILFTGFVSHSSVPRYLRSADILLMPYSNSCPTSYCMSPLKMFEYLAAGRPIVASEFPPIKEILQDSIDSILIPHDKPSKLINAIQRILDDDVLYSYLSAKALDKARIFSWAGRAKAILDAIT